MKKRGSNIQKRKSQQRNYVVVITVLLITLVILFSHSIFQGNSQEIQSVTGLVVESGQDAKSLFQQLADKALEEKDLYTTMAQNAADRQKIFMQIAEQQTSSVVSVTPPAGSDCYESDGGKDFYKKGEKNNQGGVQFPADECILTGYVTPPLKEYYCDENGQMTTKLVGCPNGCQEGACLGPKPTPGLCFDNDLTNDPTKKGAIFIIDDSFVSKPGSYSDSCISETILKQVSCNKDSNAYVKAKYPLDSAKVYNTSNCPTGQKCFNGACVQK
ncbi:hypothetical protein HYT55_05745 [Candidatus Woesearchaeota archaeon]|nr:hypothetical protein [Candidatus Woesearchaeota archaeon]